MKFFIPVILFIFLAAIIPVSNSSAADYSNTTKKCISCHNDTTYPLDTDGDGVAAPYKRPHNDIVMCESCHRSDPHLIAFIQPDGYYGPKSTAASCPECHQKGIPAENNTNFTSAFKIYSPLSHSSNVRNGSAWGNYWDINIPRTACIYCHNRTLHNVSALGRPLEWAPDYVINTSIGTNYTCSNCHYREDVNYANMITAFNASGLEAPPEITNGTNWNGTYLNYYNHTIENYTNDICKRCHGRLLSENATMSEFLHNVAFAESSACLGCHTSPTGNATNYYAAVDKASFGKHRDINTTDGIGNLTDNDCVACHYNISKMYDPGFSTDTRICTDCHIEGNFSAPIISNHRPPKAPVTAGGNISTGAYCSVCHNNSINKYLYSINASIGHYGTTSSLVKPTVNQTAMPVFGFMTPGDAQDYNKECNSCHNPSNSSYGNATLITMPHIGTATCKECHVSGNASDLHNGSLGMPVTFSCQACHTTYAAIFGAPNLTGTGMAGKSGCSGTYCHGSDIESSNSKLDTLARHNYNRIFYGTPGSTDTVYLNNQVSLNITKGAVVNITSRVNDANLLGGAPRVAGAEYYINVDPGAGKGIPMEPVDGYYDAVNGNWESVKSTLDTSGLSDGTYTIYVRGMDIGKQWSTPNSATLTVESLGYINGTVDNGTSGISGATVSAAGASTTTLSDGTYSLNLPAGTYNVTAGKQPEFYDNTSYNVVVTANNLTSIDFSLILKPTGTISGNVTNG